MPTYNEPAKTTPTYTKPIWQEPTWKHLDGMTWKDLNGITWKELHKRYGYKKNKPTFTETTKGALTYTEPEKGD